MAAAADSLLSEATALQARYLQELQSYKGELQQLKTNFFKRQIDKNRLMPAADQLAALGPVCELNNPAHDEALQKLQRIVGRVLLDPACQGVTAADTVHKKVGLPLAAAAVASSVLLSLSHTAPEKR